MDDKERIDAFLTEKVEFRGKALRRHEKFLGFAKATYRSNKALAQEAYSQAIFKLYEIMPKELNDGYVYTIIKNYSWLGNRDNRFHKRHVLVEEFWESTTNELEIWEARENAENTVCASDFKTFYGQELWREGVYTADQIHTLEKIRFLVQGFPPWAKVLYDLTYIQQMTYREISKLKKIPLGSISSMQKKLKQMINDGLKGPSGVLY